MQDKRLFYINGQWTPPSKTQDFDVIDPSNEEVCAVISLGSEKDTDLAVRAAKNAFQTWRHTSINERIELVRSVLRIYETRLKDMGEAIATEMGAPIDFATEDHAPACISHTENFIHNLKNFTFEHSLDSEHPHDHIIYEPIGVAALITPWNWPINQVSLKVFPALLTGCTCVLKPSEIAPLSAMLLADMIHEAGFPPGVFNLVNGDGLGVGRQLSSHPDVDVVSFTGSTRAGKDITKTAADTVKRVCLELGGKGANLIFHDADKDAVTRGVTHCFENTGQSCNSPSRMLVEKSRYEQACQEAKACAEQISVNTAHKNGPHIGPAVSKVQYDKIQNLIQKGNDEGATLLVGGTGRQEGLNRGYFVRPTIFANVTPQMTIAKEEIFGPVLAIIPFNSEEEAFSIANDTAYGLTNYIQTSSRERAERFARASRTGMVAINGLSRAPGIPFGGFKQSGNGREGGSWGLLEFLEIKSVSGWGYNCS